MINYAIDTMLLLHLTVSCHQSKNIGSELAYFPFISAKCATVNHDLKNMSYIAFDIPWSELVR